MNQQNTKPTAAAEKETAHESSRIVLGALLAAVCFMLLVLTIHFFLRHLAKAACDNVDNHLIMAFGIGLATGGTSLFALRHFAKKHRELTGEKILRSNAEAALLDRSRIMQATLEAIPHPLFYKDAEGVIRACNKALADFLGLPLESIIGHRIEETATRGLAEICAVSDAQLIDKPGSFEQETEIELHDGRRRNIILYKLSFVGADGQHMGIVGSIRDVTERLEAQKMSRLAVMVLNELSAAQSHEQALRNIVLKIRESGVDAVGLRLRDGEDFPYYVADALPDELLATENSLLAKFGNSCVRNENGAATIDCLCGMVLLGNYPQNAPFITPFGSFWSNSTSELMKQPDALQTCAFHVRWRCAAMGYESMALIPLRAGTEVLGLLQLNIFRRNAFSKEQVEFFETLGAGITMALIRRNTEKRIAEAEDTWNRIFNGMKDGILGVDIENFHVVLVNDAFCSLVQRSREELLQMLIMELHPSEDAPLVKSDFDKVITGKDIQFSNVRFLRKNGSAVPAEISPLLITYKGRRCAVGIVRDASERRNFEMELVQAREEAESANRAKSQFLANMSHELRTPLNPIIGFASMLLEADNLTDEQHSHVALVKQRSEDLLDLINDILDLSKIEAEKMEFTLEPFGLRRTVSDAARTVEFAARSKGLTLRTFVDKTLPDALQGDPLRLRQVIVNLLGNAVKFTEQGEVECSILPHHDEPLSRRIGPGEVALHVKIRDTGIGIPKEKINLIFEPFRQADGTLTKQFGGTGLGLTISRRLIEMMGGMLWVESELGKGSTFHFTMVLLRAKDSSIAEAEAMFQQRENTAAAQEPRQEAPKHKILVVEDDPSSRLLAGGLLKRAGYAAFFAENAQEALDKLAKLSFSAVLMDIQLPGMDGVEATRIIRDRDAEQGRHTVIIALTAFAMKGDRERFIKAGMDGYVSKPFDRTELIMTLRQAIARVAQSSQPDA